MIEIETEHWSTSITIYIIVKKCGYYLKKIWRVIIKVDLLHSYLAKVQIHMNGKETVLKAGSNYF